MLMYLHAPILHVGINERDPCSGHQSVEGTRVQVGIVLVPGNSSLLIMRSFGS